MKLHRAFVFGKFAPLHMGHQYLIASALAIAEKTYVLVWSRPDFPEMPTPMRIDWLRAIYPDAIQSGQMQIVCPADDGGIPDNAAADDLHRSFVRTLFKSLAIEPTAEDAIVSSEDYAAGFAATFGVLDIRVDRKRTLYPVSGTMLRENPRKYRQFLHPVVRAGLRI